MERGRSHSADKLERWLTTIGEMCDYSRTHVVTIAVRDEERRSHIVRLVYEAEAAIYRAIELVELGP